jgi:hypothetical protein
MAFDTSESKFNFRHPNFTNILLFLGQGPLSYKNAITLPNSNLTLIYTVLNIKWLPICLISFLDSITVNKT